MRQKLKLMSLETCALESRSVDILTDIHLDLLKLVGGGSKGKSLVKIVVGPTSAKDDKEGDISQNVQFRASLNKYKIKYTEDPVIRLSRVSSGSGIAGSVRVIYALMECNDIDIYSVYGGEALSGNVESYLTK